MFFPIKKIFFGECLRVGPPEVDVAQTVVAQGIVGAGRRHEVGVGRVQVHRRS